MNFLHDKHSRYYCIFIVTLVLLLFLMGIAVIDTQTAATKEMFLTHNNAIATSLLEEGISKEVIATALMNTEAGTTGNKFLAEIGLSNSTDIENLPYVSAVKNTILTSLFVMLFLWTLLLFLGTMLFLYRRERLYRESENIIKDYIDGNYTVHLPQSNEGTIYQLLSSVDQLATMLQAKNDTEQKTKEFLKNTISDISHQLKTPLSALMMYQEIIENEPENFETVKELHLTEGRNTGFGKILRALEENGSPNPEFETDDDHSYFISRLFVHQAFLEEDELNKNSKEYEKEPKKGAEKEPKKGAERKQDILSQLVGNPEMTQTELMEKLGLTRKQVQKDIKELQEEGLLEREGSNRKGKWIVK